MVRLKEEKEAEQEEVMMSFNSLMVRLKEGFGRLFLRCRAVSIP